MGRSSIYTSVVVSKTVFVSVKIQKRVRREIKMPKIYRKSISCRTYTRENLKLAVQKVLKENVSIRSVALKYRIPRMTLQRYLQKAKLTKDIEQVNFGPRNDHLRVFQESDENLLRDFFLYATKISFGLSIKEGRRFVYEYAMAKGLPINPKWRIEKMAPYDWFYCFMKRHNLTLQTLEEVKQTCLSDDASVFFDNLRHLLQRYQSKALDVYKKNGVNPYSRSFKVIARKVE